MRIQILILGFKGLSEPARQLATVEMFIVHLYGHFIFERSLKMVNSAMSIIRANLNLSRQGVFCLLLD